MALSMMVSAVLHVSLTTRPKDILLTGQRETVLLPIARLIDAVTDDGFDQKLPHASVFHALRRDLPAHLWVLAVDCLRAADGSIGHAGGGRGVDYPAFTLARHKVNSPAATTMAVPITTFRCKASSKTRTPMMLTQTSCV